ncbi:MAG: hypothetical protein FGM24_00140 [Candidatus Kapabacteria bacterium]|nr:hypothetical protein [Candidatus Kapabacteria bacterium]
MTMELWTRRLLAALAFVAISIGTTLAGELALLPGRADMALTQTPIPRNAAVVEMPEGLPERLRSMGDEVVLNVPAPGGSMRLRCAPFSIMTPEAMVVMGTRFGDVPVATPDHVLLRGTVDGVTGSHVFVAAFETHMVAVIERPSPEGTERLMVMPDTVIPGRRSMLVVMPMTTLRGSAVPCVSEDLPGNAERADSIFRLVAVTDRVKAKRDEERPHGNVLTAVQVATDCNFAFFQRHASNVALAAQYAITVIGGSSAVYQRDANVQLQIPYLRIWTETDPYPGDIGAALGGILNYWNANMQHVRRSVTMLLATDLGGGLAYVGVLCGGYGYNVSSVGGNVNFPADNYIWDVDVTSHELGHNIGSSHTHNCGWNPPVDSCWNAEGGCFEGTRPARGSIMSYCHLQNKGTELRFHPRVAALFRSVMDRTPCVGPVEGVRSNDVATVGITTPAPGAFVAAKTGFKPTAVVRNIGTEALAGISVTCRVTTLYGVEKAKSTQTIATLAAGASQTLTFSSVSLDSLGDHLVEVTSTVANDEHTTNDIMTRPFRVGPPPAGTLRITAPNGGETLTSGTDVEVKWTATDVKNARLEYSTNDGSTWSNVRFNVDATKQAETWRVPYTPTTTARMRIVSLENAQVSDISDAAFRIQADTDAAVIDIAAPEVNGTVSSPVRPRVVLMNNGTRDLENVEVRCRIAWVRQFDPIMNVVMTVPRLRAGSTDTVQFPAEQVLANGVHTIEVTVRAANDRNPANDRIGRSFTSVGISPPYDVSIREGERHVVARWKLLEVNDSDRVEIQMRRRADSTWTFVRGLAPSVDTYVVEAPNDDSVDVRLIVRRGDRSSPPSQALPAMPRRWPYGTRLAAPTLLGPVGGQTGVPAMTDLTWADVPGADQYEVQVATDRDFANLVYVDVTRNDGTMSVLGDFGATIWWRVRALNPTDLGPWSTPASYVVTKNCADDALQFKGDKVALQDEVTWSGGPVTLEFWNFVRSADVRASKAFQIGEADPAENRFLTHAPWDNRRLYWDYGNIGADGRLDIDYAPYLDKWTHVALVSNGVDFKAVYINGVLVASGTKASAPTNLKRLAIGGAPTGPSHVGMIDEVRLWKKVRTQDQIRESMGRRMPQTTDMRDLVGVWRFDDPAKGTTARDLSGNNRTLTLPDNTMWTASGAAVNCDDIQPLTGFSLDPIVPDTAPRSSEIVLELPRIQKVQWMDVVVSPAQDADNNEVFSAFNQPGPTVRISGLQPATKYLVRVRPRSAVGMGPWAEAVMVTPPACDSTVARFDGAPTIFTADTFRFDGRAVTIEYWTRVAAAEKTNGSSFSIGRFENGNYRGQAHSPWNDDFLYWDWGAFSETGRLRTEFKANYDTWVHVALVSDGYDQMRIYYNGNLAATSSFASRLDTASRLTIGGNTHGNTMHRGEMADFRVWNRPLTAERIRRTMFERIAEPRSGLVASFPLDEGDGSQTIDAVAGDVAASVQPAVWKNSTRPVYHAWPSIRASRTAHRSDTSTYVVRMRPGMSVQWSVAGGTIESGQGTQQIVVRWDSTSRNGRVSVARTFAGGCVDSAALDLDVQPFVSVDEHEPTLLGIRPNPADERVTIDLSSVLRSVRVVAASGAVVMERSFADDVRSADLDVRELPVGAYTLVVRTSNDTFTAPLVIQR